MRTGRQTGRRQREPGAVPVPPREAAWARAVSALTDWYDAGNRAVGTDVALALLSLDEARSAEAVTGLARFAAQQRSGADPLTGCLPVTPRQE